MANVAATEINFIKLGTGGEWEAECLQNGSIRFGYRETPHVLCTMGDWEQVRQLWADKRGDSGTGTRDMNQIRTFYEATNESIFITFSGGLLHWCRPTGNVEVLPDGYRRRKTVDGWRSTSIGGERLSMDRLSGNLLKVQMFQGTICRVKASEYLLRKLNDELVPAVEIAEKAETALLSAIVDLMRLLTWQDFELLVDLIFSSSGWRRVGDLGNTQKTVDLELVLPTTGERAFVQIKSQASDASIRDYLARFEQTTAYDKMFFVWHTGNVTQITGSERVILVGPGRLAKMVLDAGLTSWLREKVS